MNGRVYDPEIGRFVSPDILIQDVTNLQSWNAYTYVHNNPLSFTDPSGYILAHQISEAVTASLATAVSMLLDGYSNAAGGPDFISISYLPDGYATGPIHIGDVLYDHTYNTMLWSSADDLDSAWELDEEVRVDIERTIAALFKQHGPGLLIAETSAGVQNAVRIEGPPQGAEILYPAGTKSRDIRDYDRLYLNGINMERNEFQAIVDTREIPGYWNPTYGILKDLLESTRQKVAGRFLDPFAKQLAWELRNLERPMLIQAHSQGTLTVVNAILHHNLRLPSGSRVELWSPAVSRRAQGEAMLKSGTPIDYFMPWGDIANMYAGNIGPKSSSWPVDLRRGLEIHQNNTPWGQL